MLPDKFMSKILFSDTGCWLWIGAKNSTGYGRFLTGGKRYLAHRFAYENINGEIPEGNVVCHICDVRSCVNPEHLRSDSQRNNIMEMFEKNRSNRRKSYFLTSEQIQEIRKSEDSKNDLSKRYGISIGHVRKIKHRSNAEHERLLKIRPI